MDMVDKIICVVPVYNEADLIKSTIKGLKDVELIDEIIIVNDGSNDNTLDTIMTLGVRIINLDKNHGKGYAMKMAINHLEYSYIGFIDGDLGHTSKEMEQLILPVINGNADVSIAKFPDRDSMTDSKGGIGLVKLISKMGLYFFTKNKMDSILSGQRVYKKEVVEKMEYIPDRFGIEVAMTIQAINNNFSIIEVPVIMEHRYSQRNLKGFIHRGKQFKDIMKTFTIMYFKGFRG